MQTFLPYASFEASVRTLDEQRLWKQVIEAFQILKTIREGSGWRDHPATRMWTRWPNSLGDYALACIEEHVHRDVWTAAALRMAPRITDLMDDGDHDRPWWLGWTAFHDSHQSALVAKDPDWYAPFFPDAAPGLPYVWPSPYEPHDWLTDRSRPQEHDDDAA